MPNENVFLIILKHDAATIESEELRSGSEEKIELLLICTHDLERKVTGIHQNVLRMSQRKQCFTKNVNSAFKMAQNHKKYEQSEFC